MSTLFESDRPGGHVIGRTGTEEPLRIAIVSSPRSGNSWIRSTLAGALQAQEMAVHNYLDAPEDLPERCVLQIHWYREPNFQRWLQANKFKVVTIARHPLDVLISALRFICFEPETSRWLEGNTGLPGMLAASPPCSAEFLEYALSFEAENLLSITYQWWHDPAAIKIRYEDAVRDPAGLAGSLVAGWGADPDSVRPWLEASSLERMRTLPNRHGWQARPGLWKELIPPRDAACIFQRYRTLFHDLGYSVTPYFLTRKTALRNWCRL
jgi:hypothetical protein